MQTGILIASRAPPHGAHPKPTPVSLLPSEFVTLTFLRLTLAVERANFYSWNKFRERKCKLAFQMSRKIFSQLLITAMKFNTKRQQRGRAKSECSHSQKRDGLIDISRE